MLQLRRRRPGQVTTEIVVDVVDVAIGLRPLDLKVPDNAFQRLQTIIPFVVDLC